MAAPLVVAAARAPQVLAHLANHLQTEHTEQQEACAGALHVLTHAPGTSRALADAAPLPGLLVAMEKGTLRAREMAAAALWGVALAAGGAAALVGAGAVAALLRCLDAHLRVKGGESLCASAAGALWASIEGSPAAAAAVAKTPNAVRRADGTPTDAPPPTGGQRWTTLRSRRAWAHRPMCVGGCEVSETDLSLPVPSAPDSPPLVMQWVGLVAELWPRVMVGSNPPGGKPRGALAGGCEAPTDIPRLNSKSFVPFPSLRLLAFSRPWSLSGVMRGVLRTQVKVKRRSTRRWARWSRFSVSDRAWRPTA